MTAGLKFESAAGTQATNLSEVKIITLEDKTGNKYTLGLEGTGADKELKLKYTPKTGDEIEHTVDGLVKSSRGYTWCNRKYIRWQNKINFSGEIGRIS